MLVPKEDNSSFLDEEPQGRSGRKRKNEEGIKADRSLELKVKIEALFILV